jgi:C4-dicarboxylate-specific signal transduction histidine kinase
MAERISKISVSMRRLSRDSRDESKSKVFITHVLEDVQSVSSHKFYQISVDLRIDISDILHEKEVMVYPVQLSQVIINLLNNAFDAVEKVDDKFVEIQVSVKNKKNLEIRVKDSGKGIPEKLKAKIFDPFFTTKSADRGTGIGLGLCKTIVTKHEGHFYLDEQAENTCFVIEIPDAVVG